MLSWNFHENTHWLLVKYTDLCEFALTLSGFLSTIHVKSSRKYYLTRILLKNPVEITVISFKNSLQNSLYFFHYSSYLINCSSECHVDFKIQCGHFLEMSLYSRSIKILVRLPYQPRKRSLPAWFCWHIIEKLFFT